MTEFENSSAMAISTAGGGGESSISRPGGCDEIQMIPLPVTSQKKKRNLPGMPDPDSIVLALSPKTLLATNRFLCEICNKGFQRDQNLQLHRRGHNLPWKLKQRTSKEIRKKVYVCPEPTCVHHNPARALGDLTGIKKHFSRKHGEKKYKCERCSKKYAVQSDWKAHMKTCGTREYKCDCGTIFSRRDSFITHRAFCDALAEESARTTQTLVMAAGTDQLSHNKQTNAKSILVSSPPPPPLTPSTGVMSPSLSIQSSEVPEIPMGVSPPTPVAATSSSSTPATSVFASVFASSAISTPSSSFSNQICALARSDCPSASSSIEPTSLSLSSPSLYLSNNGGCSSLFSKPDHQDHHIHYAPSPLQQPAMSATALLQKAAQMGATSSNPSSFFQGLGGFPIPSATSSSNVIVKQENNSAAAVAAAAAAGLGLGLSSGLNDVMNMDPTLDLLGLGIGIGASGASNGGLSALLSSFNGDFNVGPYGDHDHHQRSGSPPERPWSTTTGVHKRNHPNGPP